MMKPVDFFVHTLNRHPFSNCSCSSWALLRPARKTSSSPNPEDLHVSETLLLPAKGGTCALISTSSSDEMSGFRPWPPPIVSLSWLHSRQMVGLWSRSLQGLVTRVTGFSRSCVSQLCRFCKKGKIDIAANKKPVIVPLASKSA